MQIEITRCEATVDGMGLLHDLTRYADAYDWVEAVMNGSAAYLPLDFHVKMRDTENAVCLISGGEDTGAWESVSRELGRIPKDRRRVVSDGIQIRADIFERELLISWC